MSENDLISRVRTFLGLGTNTYQDDLIKEYMEEVIQDMIDSGVLEEVARSRLAVGNIFRGIIDKWDYNTGADYSPMWIKRTNQLRAITLEEARKRIGQISIMRTGLKEYKVVIHSTEENQTIFDIPAELSFDIKTDVLNVRVNGITLVENVQYTKTSNQVTLLIPLGVIDTPIEITILKQETYEDTEDANV